MIKFLPVAFIVIAAIAGIIWWNFVRIPKVDLPKTPTAIGNTSLSTEDRIKKLEKYMESLIKGAKDTEGSSPSQTPVPEDRFKRIETVIDDLKKRIASLEQAPKTTTTTQTTTVAPSTSKSPVYIPLGASGTAVTTDWSNVDLLSAAIDPAEYLGYSSMVLELSLKVLHGNGQAFARLGNSTDGTAILSSEVSTTSSTHTSLTSSGFNLPNGKKTYKLQLKSTTGFESSAQNVRIKVNF